MKEYSTIPKAPILEPHYQMVLCHIQVTRGGGVLPLCRDLVDVFYSQNRLGLEEGENRAKGDEIEGRKERKEGRKEEEEEEERERESKRRKKERERERRSRER